MLIDKRRTRVGGRGGRQGARAVLQRAIAAEGAMHGASVVCRAPRIVSQGRGIDVR